jgi:hypothetical protein
MERDTSHLASMADENGEAARDLSSQVSDLADLIGAFAHRA